MKTLMDLSKIRLTTEDVNEFNEMTSDWQYYCTKLTKLTVPGIRRLMVYLHNYRPANRTMLKRAIARYNSLNRVDVGGIKWPNRKKQSKPIFSKDSEA